MGKNAEKSEEKAREQKSFAISKTMNEIGSLLLYAIVAQWQQKRPRKLIVIELARKESSRRFDCM